MKNTLKTIRTLLFVFFTIHAHAQVATEIIQNYPAHVIVNVQSVLNRVKVSPAQQERLATYFAIQDSLAESVRKHGGDIAAIAKYYVIDDDKMSKFLTSAQYIVYRTDESFSSASELAKAVKFAEQLKLTESQVYVLLSAIKAEGYPSYVFNYQEAKKSEYSLLKTTLTSRQYFDFFRVFAAPRAAFEAKYGFHLLLDNGLAEKRDSVKITAELKSFYDSYLPSIDYVSKSYPERLPLVRDSLEAKKTIDVLKVDILSGQLSQFQLFRACELRNEISLSEKQKLELISALAAMKSQLNREKFATNGIKTDIKAFTKNALKTILSREQYEKFWKITNDFYARSYVETTWSQLIKEHLSQANDSAKTCAEIYQFKLKDLTMLDTVTGTAKKEVLDSVKRLSIVYKPFVLWQLDALENNLPSSPISMIISKRHDLKLTSIQVDTLLSFIVSLEKVKAAFHNRYGDLPMNNDALVIQTIITTLTDNQYLDYLAFKNSSRAIFNADQDWEQLAKSGLADPKSDKAAMLREIRIYELKALVANEVYKNQKNQKNLLALHNVEYNKPDLLKKLDSKNNETANNKHIKESFAW